METNNTYMFNNRDVIYMYIALSSEIKIRKNEKDIIVFTELKEKLEKQMPSDTVFVAKMVDMN